MTQRSAARPAALLRTTTRAAAALAGTAASSEHGPRPVRLSLQEVTGGASRP